MRTIAAGITSAEVGPALAYRHAATIQNELLSFGSPTALANGSLDTAVTQSYRVRSSGTIAYASYRHTSGTHYLRAVDIGTTADFQLSSASATTISGSIAMRAGFSIESGTHYIYDAYSSGGAIRVRRATLTGTTNPVTATFSDFGSTTFGGAFTDTATFVRRVEAVCPTDSGQVVVCVGEHDFTNDRSTLTFWWIESNSATPAQLNAFYQFPMTETYASWYSSARHCSNVAAVALSSGGACVIAPSIPADAAYGQFGRTVSFIVRNGIDSAAEPCVPTDIEQATVYWCGSSLTTINGVIYQGGTMTRYSSDGTVLSYEGYLSSVDGKYWSVGERSHYVGSAAQRGTMLMASGGSTVYYVGGLYHGAAPATAIQNPAVGGQSVTITSDIRGFTVNQITNGADTIDVQVDNSDGAYDASTLVKRGAVLYLDSGQESTLSDFGTYGIDRVTKAVTVAGRADMKVSGRDISGKRLADYKFPVDLWLDSHGYLTTGLQNANGLAIKTRDAGYAFTTGDRLKFDGLNTPFIAYADAPNGDVSLQRATVYMGVSNNYHVSSVGFLVNATDDGAGHVVLMPKANSWTTYGKSQPEVRRLALPAVNTTDDNADDSGFTLKERTNTILTNAGNGTLRTAAVAGGTYRTRASATLAANTTYDVVTRTDGRRVQLYTKVNDYTVAGAATNAGYTLQLEWVADSSDAVRRPVKTSGGLVLATDVMSDTTLWAQAGSDDMAASLTDASNTTVFTTLVTSGQKNSGLSTRVTNLGTIAGLSVNQYVRLHAPSYVDGIFLISAIGSGTPKYIDLTAGMPGMPDGTTVSVYSTGASTYSGYASSGYSKRTPFGVTVPVDPGASKKTRAIKGRGFFVTDDATAGAIRRIDSDGVRHNLLDISPETKVGWDLTNPIPSTDSIPGITGGFLTYWTGSDPAVWRLLMSNSFLSASSLATLYNLPDGSTPAYLKVGNEIVRYAVDTYTAYGGSSASWTIIPSYYAPLATASAGTTTLRNWRSNTGKQPGDDLGDNASGGGIKNPAGLYVEVSSRNFDAGSESDKKKYYVASATYVASPSVGSTSYLTLTGGYENGVTGVDPTALTGYGDVVMVTGRAQFGATIDESKKEGHDADSPVVFYPCDSSGVQAYIKATRYDMFSGPYQTTEDAIRRICALAGQRDVTFRNAFTSTYTTLPYTFSIGTSQTNLPLFENLSNFCLDLNAHIPSAGTAGTGYNNVTAANSLWINFRNYYYLIIGTYNKAEDIAAGRQGTLRVGLMTTSSDVNADGFGNRWLEWAIVPVGDYNVSGTYTGSNPNYTTSEVAARNCIVRVVAHDNLVYLEVNGKHVWTFNLSAYTDGGSVNCDKRTAGPIGIFYNTAVGGNAAVARVLELGDPVPAVTVSTNTTARAGIDQVTADRHIKSRAGQTGGVEFSQYINRDDGGTLRYNLLKHDWTQEDTRNAGHVQVTGNNVSGEALDDTQLRAEGYMFDTADNRLITLATHARLEARLWQRDMEEGYQVDQLTGYARIALQPEDKISLNYAPPTEGITTVAATDKVIDSINLTSDEKAMKATYQIRRYVSTL